MNKYITSKKHKTANYLGASVVTATVLLTSPIILQAESTVLQKVDVVGVEDLDYSNSYKVNKSSSSKVTQDLVDTPQTITVITKKVMEEQQATTLVEALRNTPGITLNLGENGNTNSKDNINMRGFDAQGSIYKDGIRDLANSSKDTFNTEAVEVTKGGVGADNGRGVSSGYINQVTKSATNKDEVAGTLGYSTAKNARLTADLNKKLNETTGVRLNVMKQDGEVAGRDEVEIDRTGIAGSVGFGIGTATRTTINYEHTEQDDVPDGGIPTVGLDGSAQKADTSTFYGSSDDFEEAKNDTFTIKFEQDISDNTIFTNTSRYAKTNQEMLLTSPFNFSTTANTVTRSMHARWQENEILTNQSNFTTEIQTGMLLHKISTGIELIKENQVTKNYTSQTAQTSSLYNPTNISWSDLTLSGQKSDGETTTVGAYLFDSINIGEKFIFTGGGRFDKYDTTNDIVSSTLVPSTIEDKGNLNSYKAGLVYKPLDNGSVYISRATTQLAPGGANFTLSATTTSANNPNMEPQKSTTDEIGTKWDLLNNRLSLTTAIYKTVVENETMTESDGSTSQNGEKEVEGIEFGAVGEITDKWNITAGLAKMNTEYTNSTSTNEGLSLRFSPEHTATLWSTYKFTSVFNVGVGARYVGTQTVTTSTTSTAPIKKIDEYTVYDAMASYKFNKNLTYQLNIYNLTDEEYVSNMNNAGRRYTPGASRSGLLTLAYKF
ncbi:catecholate siderophore receptor [Arcobacter venerupis]|uniref:Catecholate siderophore receptor n=1 Tax=Arcobacter venerupis TaxID=1054033 RepID=A0AAE7E3C2_9BACT|nr:TonB-dependent siderophore receptor [Arcobacter venerupis]QKF66189.1 catecholate siderophore receptor [Arcobacter venerupis]RWS51024.1 TonB-dependent siderophore receptor [Arcobacter venerupis]